MANTREERYNLLVEHGFSKRTCEVLSTYPCVDLIISGNRKQFLDAVEQFKIELIPLIGESQFQRLTNHFSHDTGELDLLKQKIAIERKLLNNLDDTSSWLVYADLLQTMGEPLGEYIMIVEQLKNPDLTDLQKDEMVSRLNEIAPTVLNGMVNCFFIEELEDRFRLHNVSFQNERYVLEWSKELLDGAVRKTQDAWLKWLKGKEWKLPDAFLFNATVFELYQNRECFDKKQQEIINKFKKVMSRNWIMTCTRIKYTTREKDVVMHNYGYENRPKLEVDIVGPNNVLIDSYGVHKDSLFAIMGTSDNKLVDKAYAWLCDFQKPYMMRFYEKPKEEFLQPVVFAFLPRFVLDIYNSSPKQARGLIAHTAKEFYHK